jgi:hypothetical protein
MKKNTVQGVLFVANDMKDERIQSLKKDVVIVRETENDRRLWVYRDSISWELLREIFRYDSVELLVFLPSSDIWVIVNRWNGEENRLIDKYPIKKFLLFVSNQLRFRLRRIELLLS